MLHHFLYRFNASLISSRSLSSTVFVKGISFSSTEETLTQAFSQYGRVDGVNVIMDKVRCRPKGYAYVTFSSDEEAQKALLELNGKLVDGRVVILDTVKPLKHNRPDTKLKPEGEEKLQQGAMAVDKENKSSGVFDLSAIKPGMAAEKDSKKSSLVFDTSAIKPGMAVDMKFKGSETCPNLPWVSTRGSGPHGRTISGVTYRYNENEIRIVCACHNSHMLPQDFVPHANQEMG